MLLLGLLTQDDGLTKEATANSKGQLYNLKWLLPAIMRLWIRDKIYLQIIESALSFVNAPYKNVFIIIIIIIVIIIKCMNHMS